MVGAALGQVLTDHVEDVARETSEATSSPSKCKLVVCLGEAQARAALSLVFV